MTNEDMQKMLDLLTTDYEGTVKCWDVEFPQRYWDTRQFLKGILDNYRREVREFIRTLCIRLGLPVDLLPVPPPFRGQGLSKEVRRKEDDDIEFLALVRDFQNAKPIGERNADILDMAEVIALVGGQAEYPETSGNSSLGGWGGPVGEALLDIERGWVVAHQLRARITDEMLGPFRARFHVAWTRYLERAPKRSNAYRRFLEMPPFDPALTVTVYDKTLEDALAEFPNFSFDRFAQLETIVLTSCRSTRSSHWTYQTQPMTDRYNLLAGLYSNMPLREYKPLGWWMGGANTTLERFKWKHEQILKLSERLPDEVYDAYVNEHLREIVHDYKIWANPIIASMGEGRKLPAESPEGEAMAVRPESYDIGHRLVYENVHGKDAVMYRFH